MQRPGCRSLFMNVMHAVPVQFVFKLGAEAGSLQRFGKKIPLQCFVLQVRTDVGEALLPVLKNVDDFLDYFFYFTSLLCIRRHDFPSLVDWPRHLCLMKRSAQGPSAVGAILLRRRQAEEIAKIPLPCRTSFACTAYPSRGVRGYDADCARGFAS